MRVHQAVAGAVLTVTVAVASAACSTDTPQETSTDGGGAAVVVSNTWVGALAKAAGATDIAVIMPVTVPDQAAYRPTPEDLAPAAEAEHLLYAESDGFADQLKTAAGGDVHQTVVTLSFDPATVQAEVTKLGELFGTQARAAQWLQLYQQQYTGISESLKGVAPIPPSKVVAEADVAHWAPFSGMQVVGTYGPGPVPADKLALLVAARPKLVFRNVHVPQPAPQIPGSIVVDLANYPGPDLDLLATVRTNGDRLGATLAK